MGTNAAARSLAEADTLEERGVCRDWDPTESRVEIEKLAPCHRRRESDVLRQEPHAGTEPRSMRASGIFAKHGDAAFAGLSEAQHHLDERALAGAVVTDQRHALAGREREVERAHGIALAVALRDLLDLDRRRGHQLFSGVDIGSPFPLDGEGREGGEAG